MAGPVRRDDRSHKEDGRNSQKRWRDQSEEKAGPVRRVAEPDRRWQNQKNEMSRPVKRWRTRQERWQDQKGEMTREMQYIGPNKQEVYCKWHKQDQ